MKKNIASYERYLMMLTTAFGKQIMELFSDQQVIEIMLNPDGRVFVESINYGKKLTNIKIPTERSENIIKVVASLKNQIVDDETPVVASELPFHGARFQGWLPPVVSAPCFAIRKRANKIFTLDDYHEHQSISLEEKLLLKELVKNRKNIVISGGTGSGKTTFANALLHELADSEDRIIIIEDLPELQLDAVDTVNMISTSFVTIRDLVKGALRMRPDRIIIGEVRDGAALELLKSWNTGHPGGICTIHANTAESTPSRFEDLLQEVVMSVSKRLIAESIDVIVCIERTKAGQHRIKDIQSLNLHQGQFVLKPYHHEKIEKII